MVWTWFRKGVGTAVREWRVVLYFYLALLVAALPAALAFRQLFRGHLDRSAEVFRLGGSMDMDIFLEFLTHGSSWLSPLPVLVLAGALLYWFALMVLSGGLFAQLIAQRSYQAAQFWADAFRFVGRMVRLSFLSLPVLAVLFSIQYLEVGLQRLIFGKYPYEYIAFWGKWIQLLLMYIGLWTYHLIFDFARWELVARNLIQTRRALINGVLFFWRQKRSLYSLYALYLLCGAIVLLVYNLFSSWLKANSIVIIALLLLLQQGYLLVRSGLKVALFASEAELYLTNQRGSTNRHA